MSVAIETATLDPAEFSESGIVRTALNLDELGLRIVGADWGDSEIELFLIKQLQGEIPANRRPINRTVTIKLQVKKDLTINLAEAAAKLEKKIGLMQAEGGWVGRMLKVGGGFSAPVGFKVRSATITGLGGWMMAHRSIANEVTITFLCSPYCYSSIEDESVLFTAETGAANLRGLVYTLATTKGSAPGLRRIVITNKNVGGPNLNFHGLIAAEETRTYSAAATAELMYDAEKLTLLGAATEKEREGVKVVRCEKVASLWQSMLGSKIAASGLQMSHVGNRRMWFRIYDPSATAGEIKLKLEWRAAGSPHWSENDVVVTPLSKGWALVDLGECRLPIAVRGTQAWEWRVSVMTSGAVATLDIDQVFPLPTEQFLFLQSVDDLVTPATYKGLDSFDSSGAATGKTPIIGPAYTAVTNSDATDFEENGGKLIRIAASDTGAIGVNTVEGRAIGMALGLEGPTALQMDFSHNLAEPNKFTWGFILRYVNDENMIVVKLHPVSELEPLILTVVKRVGAGNINVFGGVNLKNWFPNLSWQQPTGRLLVKIEGETLSVYYTPNPENDPVLIGVIQYADFVGALKLGSLNIFDTNLSVTGSSRTYDNLGIWVPEIPAVCVVSRGLELRSDGCYRQQEVEDTWGQVIPDGFLPYSAPSGLEARPSRGIIIPTQGDLNLLPDAGATSNKIQATVFSRAAYHFTSEAS